VKTRMLTIHEAQDSAEDHILGKDIDVDDAETVEGAVKAQLVEESARRLDQLGGESLVHEVGVQDDGIRHRSCQANLVVETEPTAKTESRDLLTDPEPLEEAVEPKTATEDGPSVLNKSDDEPRSHEDEFVLLSQDDAPIELAEKYPPAEVSPATI
jgi:hypothetical protein